MFLYLGGRLRKLTQVYKAVKSDGRTCLSPGPRELLKLLVIIAMLQNGAHQHRSREISNEHPHSVDHSRLLSSVSTC